MRYIDYIQNGPDDGVSRAGFAVDLGYIPSANMVIKLGLAYPTGGFGGIFFGRYDRGNSNYVRLFAHRNYDLTYDNPRDANLRLYLPIQFGVKKNIELGVYPTCYIKDVDTGTIVNGTGSVSYNYNKTLMCWQDWDSSGNICGGKIYYVELYENGMMVRQYLPALDNNSRPGLYETVTKTFLTNTGTPFTYGSVLSSILIDPDSKTVAASGDTFTVEVSSDNDWTATPTDGSWYSLSQTGGTSADTAITITVDANSDYSGRQDTIVFEDTTTSDSVTFTLKQKKYSDGQPMYIGSSEITEFYIGANSITEMYLGTELVFSASNGGGGGGDEPE